jgi:hypothetical protein
MSAGPGYGTPISLSLPLLMPSGCSLDYSWLDANKKPLRLPAPTYIEYVLQWISNRINDESIFPTKANPTTTATINTPSAGSTGPSPTGVQGARESWIGKDGGFPQSFYMTCKAIYKQMFRVFAHIYHTHFAKIVHMSLEAHFNSFFAHFVHFARVRYPRYSIHLIVVWLTLGRRLNFWNEGILNLFVS